MSKCTPNIIEGIKRGIPETGISSNAMANLGKNKSVQVEVLVKICNHLNCTLDDILEILPNENEDKIEGE